jgi:hypothetical protein
MYAEGSIQKNNRIMYGAILPVIDPKDNNIQTLSQIQMISIK